MTTQKRRNFTGKNFQVKTFLHSLRNINFSFGPHQQKINVPPEYRSNFRNLYLEIAWYAILNGTALNFLSVFATRSGATNQQIGWIAAVPAVANLLFSIPASVWLQKLPTSRMVYISAFLTRIFYLGLAVLPFFISNQPLIWAIIIGTFLLSIPGTGLAVGVNALIAETVPVEWRAHVVSRRNMLLALCTVLTLTLSGQILSRVAFPINYQIIFFIGFLGAMLSCLHLSLIKPISAMKTSRHKLQMEGTRLKESSAHIRLDIQKKMQEIERPQKPSFAALKGKFAVILLIIFAFWFALYLAIPLFAPYMVNVLHLNDRTISLGNGFSTLVTLLITTQIGGLSRRFSNRLLTAVGMSLATIYPILMPLCTTPFLFILVSALGGTGWGAINTCLFNYVLERIPETDMAGHLAWYNIALNAAILGGSLLGPLIAGHIGITTAMLIFGFGRLMAGLALLRWG